MIASVRVLGWRCVKIVYMTAGKGERVRSGWFYIRGKLKIIVR